MSSAPVDVEINLKEKPKFRLNVDSTMAPYGPNAQLKSAKLESNPKIHTKVYNVFSDKDMKANDALVYLYKASYSPTQRMKLSPAKLEICLLPA